MIDIVHDDGCRGYNAAGALEKARSLTNGSLR